MDDHTLDPKAGDIRRIEVITGAAAHAGIVFGVILGTGVGGGLVVNRQLITGRNKIAGEWGHNLCLGLARMSGRDPVAIAANQVA